MNQFLYTLLGSYTLAGYVRTALATGKLRLYASPLTLNPSILKAALVAAEATYDGYAAYVITTWNAVYYDPSGGSSFQAVHQFDFTPGAGTVNTVYGFWVEDTAGNLLVVGNLPAPVVMQALGDSIPMSVTLNYGASA